MYVLEWEGRRGEEEKRGEGGRERDRGRDIKAIVIVLVPDQTSSPVQITFIIMCYI